MRKLSMAVLAAVIALAGCSIGSRKIGQVNPRVSLDPDQTYTITYWDVELPWVLDPQGVYRPRVEELLREFSAENPGIKVEARWLEWTKADAEINQALRDGTPPDLWSEWQGLARWDHILQVPAGLWTDSELLTPAGKRAASQEGQLWAWPRWLWPRGLLALGIEGADTASTWDWQECGQWLKARNLYLDVNDWQGEFSTQAMLAATGYGYTNWGGQELSEVFAALELLRTQGLVTGTGSYREITGSKVMIAGFTPALVTRLAESSDQDLVLLPMPGIAESTYIPVSTAHLVQFRQLNYKGDEHSLAAAMLAEFMAMKQGIDLADVLWAAPAWVSADWNPEKLPLGYGSLLADAMEKGVPVQAIDALGRSRETKFREQMGPVLKDFWSGKANSQEVASRLEELQ